MQPAVLKRLGRRLGIVPISLHDVVAGDQNFAVLGDAHPDAVERWPDGVDFDPRRHIAADDRSGLGLAVALQ